eukprot:12856840-Prorocentrum_lima.AAC.1
MGAPGVVSVECEGGVRERQVWLVLQQPPIQEANKVGGSICECQHAGFGELLKVEEAKSVTEHILLLRSHDVCAGHVWQALPLCQDGQNVLGSNE